MWAHISNIYQQYIINKSSPQWTQRTQDVCTIFFLLRTTILGVYQQQLNRVQLYKSTSSICKTQLAFSASTEMRQQSSTDINLYHKQEHQPCTNLCHKQVHQPCTNLYHKQVHPTMYQVYTNHVSTNHQQWLNNMYQHHQLYTSCMCQLINYLSQPCTQHVPQPKALINFIIKIWFVALK